MIFIQTFVLCFPIALLRSNRQGIIGLAGLNRQTRKQLYWEDWLRGYLENKLSVLEDGAKKQIIGVLRNQTLLIAAGIVVGIVMYCPVYGFAGILIGFVFAILFCVYPLINIEKKIARRKAAILKELPEAITNIAVVTDAGLNLQQALVEVANLNGGEIGTIIKKAMVKADMGKPLTDALEEIPELKHVEELNRVVSCMVQTIKKGSSGITKVLREQANRCWTERKNRLRQAGHRASFKLFIPVYLLVFPAAGMLMITPAIMNIIDIFVGY